MYLFLKHITIFGSTKIKLKIKLITIKIKILNYGKD